MHTATTLLIISGSAISVMVALKALEIRLKKKLLSKILPHNHKVVGGLHAAGNFISSVKQKQTVMLQNAITKSKAKSIALAEAIREQAGKKSVEFGERIRGRKILKHNGPVSFFLRHVAEYKDHSADTRPPNEG